jgi:hypothetical protein
LVRIIQNDCTLLYTLTRETNLVPHLSKTREGIQERTLTLRFLGRISRVLRLEVSTLVFCLSTRRYSPNLSFIH